VKTKNQDHAKLAKQYFSEDPIKAARILEFVRICDNLIEEIRATEVKEDTRRNKLQRALLLRFVHEYLYPGSPLPPSLKNAQKEPKSTSVRELNALILRVLSKRLLAQREPNSVPS